MEKIIGHVDPFICILLTANGYTSLYAFDNVEGSNQDGLYKSIQDNLNELTENSRFYAEIPKYSPMSPPNLKLGQGHINALNHIFKILSPYDKEKFYQENKDVQTTSGISTGKRNSDGTKRSEKLPPGNDYAEILKDKTLMYMKIADPEFSPVLQLTEQLKTDVKEVYGLKCSYCDFSISIFAYQSGGYTRFDLKALEIHMESRHKTQSDRFKAHKEQLKVKLKFI